ncbi:hypothetical protein AAZX31_01G142700 [Glycine max]
MFPISSSLLYTKPEHFLFLLLFSSSFYFLFLRFWLGFEDATHRFELKWKGGRRTGIQRFMRCEKGGTTSKKEHK